MANEQIFEYNNDALNIWDKPSLSHLLADAHTESTKSEQAFSIRDIKLTDVYYTGNFSNRYQLIDIFTNLFTNAWRYRSSDNPSVEVSHTWLSDGSLEITLSDDGIGIEHDNIFRLGTLHYREGRKEVKDSHGDGLNAVIQNLRELEFGPLWVRSEVGAGSAFRFVVPAHFLIRRGHSPATTHNPRLAIKKSRLEGFYVPDEALDLLEEEE